jgi:hypothetical protein
VDLQQPFFSSKSDARFIYKAKSTVESTNREKFAKFVFEPDETRSPVDLGCEIPARCASFVQVKRESRKLKTRWRMTQSAANQSLSTCQPVDTLAAVDKRWLTRHG